MIRFGVSDGNISILIYVGLSALEGSYMSAGIGELAYKEMLILDEPRDGLPVDLAAAHSPDPFVPFYERDGVA